MHDASVQSGRKAATPPKVAQGGGKRSAAAPTGVWGGKRRRRAASPLMCSAGVGIGTTAPLNNFELYNNGGVGGTTQANITSWAGGATTTNTAALNLRVQGAGSGSVDNIISAQYNASGAGNYSIALKPGGATTAMTVVGNGNVGIGTAVPSAPLHVYSSGGISLATTGTVNYTNSSILGFGFGGGSSGTRDSFRIISQVVNRDNGAGPYYDYGVQADLVFQRKTNNLYASAANDITYTEVMRIHGATGFVGIGTPTPESLLTLYGSTPAASAPTLIGQWKAQHAIYATGSYVLKLGAHYTAGVGAYSSIQSTEFYSGTEHPGYLNLNPLGGSVGIGITNPSTGLHVNSATAFSGIQLTNTYNGTTGSLGFYIVPSAGGNFINSSTGNAGVILPSDGKDLYIGRTTANNTSLVVQGGTGNIGIGKTNPLDRLDVTGGIKATNGFYSYNTSFFYYAGNATWSPGDPTNWPFGGNVFLVTLRGPSGNGGNAVRGAFIVFHSRWGAGNNNYGQIVALANSWVSTWGTTDGGLYFTFNSPDAQTVYINFLVLN